MKKNISTSGPQFSPQGGIGTVWKDPNSGESWKYTASGWKKVSPENIQKEVEAKQNFDVKPNEEPIVQALKEGGANQDQINNALIERRNILSTKQNIDIEGAPITFDEYRQKAEELVGAELGPDEINQLKTQYQNSFGTETVEQRQDTQNPFGGMTKQQLLRDAYSKGVTSIAELEKLEKLYDKLVGEKEGIDEDFTATEKRKLEQAGLLNASRQEKLDYLYGI